MKISVIGVGYVGLSLAVLISQKYEVIALDVDSEKINLINKKKSFIKDKDLEKYLKRKDLKLKATLNREEAYANSEFILIATPTNYNINTGEFDTSSVEKVISDCMKFKKNSSIIIKSTVPLGFTDLMRNKFKKDDIYFSPEFLRESKSLYDNLYPSRIIVGGKSKKAKKFGEILINCAHKSSSNNIPVLYMESSEAEAVKLFSNTYLAMRVSFFNELDSFSEIQNLSSKKIIEGISLDPRIGNYYNNPSFGYGGYCLPKDTKQLLDNFANIPNNIIKAVVESNKTRKNFIVNSIKDKFPKVVGVYRLIMKKGSDNFRESAILDIINKLKKEKISIIVYEPLLKVKVIDEIEVIKDLSEFISKSDLIIANRISKDLDNVRKKVYSRDIFQEN